jgi:hypothetical protein
MKLQTYIFLSQKNPFFFHSYKQAVFIKQLEDISAYYHISKAKKCALSKNSLSL